MRGALAAVLLLPGAAAAAPEFTAQGYNCDRGVAVPATYVTTPEGALVVIHVDGRQIALLAEPAASGARYAWPSGGSGYVWWTRGDEATLLWKTPEGETRLLTCAAAG